MIYSDHLYRDSFRNSTDDYAEPYLEYANSSSESPSYFDMYSALTACDVLSVAQNHVVWIGEVGDRLWGMNDNSTEENLWFNSTLALLDQLGVGFAGWAAPPWSDGTGDQFGFVMLGEPNYTLDNSGMILVNHLNGQISYPSSSWFTPDSPSPLAPTASSTLARSESFAESSEILLVLTLTIIISILSIAFIFTRKKARQKLTHSTALTLPFSK